MKKFLKSFINQTGVKPFLIMAAVVVPIFTFFWSKQDDRFNPYVIIGAGVFFILLLFCEWIANGLKRK